MDVWTCLKKNFFEFNQYKKIREEYLTIYMVNRNPGFYKKNVIYEYFKKDGSKFNDNNIIYWPKIKSK